MKTITTQTKRISLKQFGNLFITGVYYYSDATNTFVLDRSYSGDEITAIEAYVFETHNL